MFAIVALCATGARGDEAPSDAAAPVTLTGPPETWGPIKPATLPAFDEHRARSLYDRNCRLCHGEGGAGDGAIARDLEPRPRDLTRGVYKFRSTPTGEPPTDRDLFDTLTRGLPGTAMSSWSGLSVEDRWQLVQFVKRLSPRFAATPPETELVIGAAPPADAEHLARGRDAWVKAKCAQCHGDDGRGWGPAARTQKDDLGRPIYPFNLTRSDIWRTGGSPADFYRTLFTGLDGTSMPSYSGALSDEEAWDLAHYVRALAVDRRAW